MRLRPDLSLATLIGHIDSLGNDTVYDRRHWAQVCLDRAQADSPLPWEAGYIERRYLALLSRSPS
ncbi:hypothetical protein NJC40_08835 [Pseudomonas sp. 21LCFQ02]|uniref:hypothetical protein n=1 Tax=Pseudomonas sp. 21LCFQ02 TaxID=2957505 RepID=UPI00209A8D5D|nr:hypothetical protein [Pseudomonas sp. 21LCFQ02]MCO8167883.1 hypothetical protein [Pseudomonas sp. 21LCFQ02]